MHDTSGNGELVERLFAPPQRWGWEYVEPAPGAVSPLAAHQPVWREPPPVPVRDISRWVRFRDNARAKLRTRLFTVLVVAALLGIATDLRHGDGSLIGVLVAVVGCGAVIATVAVPRRVIRSAQVATSRRRDAMHAQFLAAHRDWEQQIQAHYHAEQHRRASALLWYPVIPQSSPSRVDVFGGTGDGWASLVTTLGSAVLGAGGPMLVLDFSEQNVAGGLAEYALRKQYPITEVDIPDDARPTELLTGLDADHLAELLAEAIETLRQGGDTVSLRALDAELLGIVARRLQEPPTFARLTAGLQVLRRVYDVSATDGLLSRDEVDKLSAHVDLVGHTEREQDELQFLTSVLGLLAREDATGPDRGIVDAEAAGAATRSLPATGLTVITIKASQPRGKDILDRVLFHRILHGLRHHDSHGAPSTVVVAGADRLGLSSLEEMATQARRVGVRLIVLLEHLRDDLERLLGTSDSAAILMTLGNAQEADKAAQFIGRGHKFVVSQLTKQIGDTFTTGTAESRGTQEGTADTRGTNDGTTRSRSRTDWGWPNTSRSKGGSKANTQSRSSTWQSTTNQSIAKSMTSGSTSARVYEFTIEPAEIQNLPTTAYILVERGRSGRRVVMGDCNPGIVLLDRVAPHPRGG